MVTKRRATYRAPVQAGGVAGATTVSRAHRTAARIGSGAKPFVGAPGGCRGADSTGGGDECSAGLTAGGYRPAASGGAVSKKAASVAAGRTTYRPARATSSPTRPPETDLG